MLGNCLIGAAILAWRFRQYSPRIKILWRGRRVPHIVVRLQQRKRTVHFKYVRDVLPLPLGYTCFIGKFCEL